MLGSLGTKPAMEHFSLLQVPHHKSVIKSYCIVEFYMLGYLLITIRLEEKKNHPSSIVVICHSRKRRSVQSMESLFFIHVS